MRRLAAGVSAGLAALLLSACEHRDDARSVAADCVRSLSTLAPIMGGHGRTPCAAMPPEAAPDGPALRLARAQSPDSRALLASAR
ncbi:hypothetical protein [Variovorax saccharolyticus]|uniref:hypothetical protein n=1 Tax=Variovorax saccharolyticus TaxID=3053516 RepID=UPI002578A14C|nr:MULTISPECIES: hypothetical protein [unclassified Variovorax]MDM0016022.1 hypothetical protein [Variovorax sp. J22R187]MDM0025062.1 hypothetical protein [Variovorax sp. J31P216]